MKKAMRTMFAGALAGSVCLGAVPAFAQTVEVDGPAVILHVSASGEEGAETQEAELQSFELIGLAGDSQVLIRADVSIETDGADAGAEAEVTDENAEMTDEYGYTEETAPDEGTETAGGFLYVSRDELESVLPDLDCSSLPQMEAMTAIGPGSGGDEVVMLQETLISLGMLSGGADGDYGSGTAGAVSTFQAAHGLDATGTADIYTMMLITAIHDGMDESVTVSAGGYDSPEEKFPEIAGKTDADLSKYMDNIWRFRFDAFEDAGTIDPSVELGTFEVILPEIDRISGTASLKVQVQKDEASGTYALTPAIVVETIGAYRPYMQGAYLTGSSNVKLDGGTSTGGIQGASLLETGCIPLTEEALSLLKSGEVSGIRLLGKNSEYDLSLAIDSDRLAAALAAF